jgi:hypothetical protein
MPKTVFVVDILKGAKMKKNSLLVSVLLGGLALVACTPEQVVSFESLNGSKFSPESKQALISLPDVPWVFDFTVIDLDGTFSKVDVPPTIVTIVETTVPPIVAPEGSHCPQFYAVALEAGWSESEWPRLDKIMFRESRCHPDSHNPRPPDNSYGLLQLNMLAHKHWVRPLVDGDFNRLFDPLTNLRVARVLFDKNVSQGVCGWRPWAMSC